MRRLTMAELSAVREVLIGQGGEQIRLNMFDLALNKPPRGGGEIISELSRIGWVDNGMFTELGRLLKDPLREYSFWIERGRQLPSENCVPILQRECFRGKRVLELGSGGGCNLLSLTGIPCQLTGLEPMPAYLQMCVILSEMSGLPEPELIAASAENIPLDDSSYDVVICYSSHQYMDINKAISEMSRVLAPGGRLIVVGNSLRPFVTESALGLFTHPSLGRTKFNIIAITNTLIYQILGRRLIKDTNGTTATPIYPSRWFMLRRLQQEGLIWSRKDTCAVDSGETVLVANKPPL